ncbi:MAG: two-component system sensor histidine kinase [Anaerocolumna sp.]|jgi:signal transduction histidine kinase|nr:two-component system sensor histidine kinase [Anaerocolumna sp.]
MADDVGQCKSHDQLNKEIEYLKNENNLLKNLIMEAQVRLEKERSFLFSLIDGIPAYVYLQDKDYSIKYANKTFYECYGGYDMKPCYKVMHGRDIPCETCMTFRVFETKEPQIWIYRDNKSGAIYRVYDYPFTDNNGTELVLEMGIDITVHQKNEDSRSNLYANISHELRTPLTKIIGYSEAIIDGKNKEEDYRHYAESIHNNSNALSRLINDLFELSKLETSQKLDFEVLDLSQVLLDFCDEQEFYFGDTERKFEYEILPDLPEVKVDINRIVQVLNNIIENATRYTKKGDSITLRAFTQDKNLIILVADSGKGIAPEDIKNIFNRFYQGIRREYNNGNCGLGLHICKTIIEQHKGKIWAENRAGGGAAFYIELPAAII